jgi:eukaryotic-like serine/threonine-protein kinase
MKTTTHRTFIEIVEEIAFFQAFTPEEMEVLLQAGKWSKVAPRERIVQQGEQDLHMYVLVQGQAEVIYNDKVVGLLNSGDIFGEVGLMGNPRIAHVESNMECLLLAFEANDLNNLPLSLQVTFLRRVLDTVFARLQKSNVQKWLTARDKTQTERMLILKKTTS